MTTKRNAKYVPEVVTTIRLSRDQHQRLKLLADRECRSFSAQLRKLVLERLEEEEAKEATSPAPAA